MTSSIARRRRFAFAALAVIVLSGALLILWTRAPAWASAGLSTTPAAGAPAGEAVLVARAAGDHDALWLLSPTDGTPTAAGDLPGKAGAVAVSPDGANVAYLPRNGAARVWIGYGPLAPRTVSLAGAGVKRVHGLTWIDAQRLVLSGVTRRSASSSSDGLYVANVATGKVKSFRDLHGTEPYAAPAAGKLVYVKLTTVSTGRAPVVRESLKLLSLKGTGAGRTLATEQYQVFAEHRAYSEPQLSPDAVWLLTGETGSDVRVTYALRPTEWGSPFLTLFTPAVQAGAGWDASGARTAVAGVPDPLPGAAACIWVYDVRAGSLVRTPESLSLGAMIERLAWSPSGRLVASVWPSGSGSGYRDVVVSADLGTATDIGVGRLPAWIQR
jgi:hypothetical protein